MGKVVINTFSILDVLTAVGGMWKIIGSAAAFILTPLLFKAFYTALANYLIDKEDDKKLVDELKNS